LARFVEGRERARPTVKKAAVVTSALVLALGIAGCSVRLASPGDLVGPVGKADAGAGPADLGEGGAVVMRLAVKCARFTPPPASAIANVPAGSFPMGCDDATEAQAGSVCRADEMPAHVVDLAAYSIDRTEVTQAQYYACVAAGACRQPACDFAPCDGDARANHPIVCVDRVDAEAYCHFRGMRLPSEAEWERAARGDDGRVYPWGSATLDCAHANMAGCPTAGTLTVGSLAAGASPYGVLDLAGNVVEWVEDAYDPTYYGRSPGANPAGPLMGARFGGRGGGWRSTGEWQRASQRDAYEPEYLKDSLGLRCASSTPAAGST
jgi:iron(II)-dependent oxidoreductase